MNNSVTLRHWLSSGWRTFTNNLLCVGSIAFIYTLLSWSHRLADYPPYGPSIYYCFVFFIQDPFCLGWAYVCLRIVRGERPQVADVFIAFRRLGPVLLASLVVHSVTVLGLLLFVVPGIVWGLKYGFSLMVVVDRRYSVIDALRMSAQLTYGYRKKLFGLFVIATAASAACIPWMQSVRNMSHGGDVDFRALIARLTPYVMYCLVVLPWLMCAAATAYDELLRRYEQRRELGEEESP